MADAQGRNPGDPNYDASTEDHVPQALGPSVSGPANPQTEPTQGTGTIGDLLAYLGKFTDSPQAAVDRFNQDFPSNTVRPAYYADRRVVGVQGQRLPYLTAPGTTQGQTTWDFGGVAGGDSGGIGGTLPPGSPGLLDPYGGQPPPGFAPPPGSELPGRFSYPDFKAPTYQEAFDDPGYQFTVGEGEHALQNSAFGKGVGRTGGTLKDLINYGQAAATTQYGTVLNRNLGVWRENQGNQAGIYGLNTQNAKDIYSRYADFYRTGHDDFTGWQNGVFDKLYRQQQLGVNANQ